MYNAWEMERHHSAERNLYPEVLDVLARIKEDHPGVVFGAVTDGRANPLLMPFTLAQWFDFCVSWEDDQGGRTKFFTELHDATDDEQLMWIYEAALDKYREISALRGSLRRDDGTEECDVSDPGCHDVWIHEQTDKQTDRQTDRRTFRLIESIGPEGRCFEKCTLHKSNMSMFPLNPSQDTHTVRHREKFKVNVSHTAKYMKSTIPYLQRRLNSYAEKLKEVRARSTRAGPLV